MINRNEPDSTRYVTPPKLQSKSTRAWWSLLLYLLTAHVPSQKLSCQFPHYHCSRNCYIQGPKHGMLTAKSGKMQPKPPTIKERRGSHARREVGFVDSIDLKAMDYAHTEKSRCSRPAEEVESANIWTNHDSKLDCSSLLTELVLSKC